MTLKQFADSIGVSTATVSNAFTGKGTTNAATRRRVLDAAVVHGFTPHRGASFLAKGKTNLIAIESGHDWDREDPVYSVFGTEYATTVLASVQLELGAAGYALYFGPLSNQSARCPALINDFRAKAIDGAIIFSVSSRSKEYLQQLREEQRPVVVLSFSPDGVESDLHDEPSFGVVSVALRPGVKDLVRYLLDLGHREAIFVNDLRAPTVFEVFREECASSGLKMLGVIESEHSLEGGISALNKILSLPALPSVIAARTDRIAFGIVQEARRRGIAIPQDLSVVGFDNDSASSVIDPPLTTVGVDPAAIGRLAARRLLTMLDGHEHDVSAYRSESKLIIRKSAISPTHLSSPTEDKHVS